MKQATVVQANDMTTEISALKVALGKIRQDYLPDQLSNS